MHHLPLPPQKLLKKTEFFPPLGALWDGHIEVGRRTCHIITYKENTKGEFLTYVLHYSGNRSIDLHSSKPNVTSKF